MESKYKVGEVLLVNNKYLYRVNRVERVINERHESDILYTLCYIKRKRVYDEWWIREWWIYQKDLENNATVIKSKIGKILYDKNN